MQSGNIRAVFKRCYIIIFRQESDIEIICGENVMLNDNEGFKQFLSLDKMLIIYGNGYTSECVKLYLEKLNIQIKALVVGDKYYNDECANISKYDVFSVSGFPFVKQDYKVLIATAAKFHEQIEDVLKSEGYENIHRVIPEDRLYLLLDVYKDFIKEYNIMDMNTEIIDISGYRLNNPALLGKDFLYTFLCEIGDLLYPAIFQEYSFVLEGPYELHDMRGGAFCVNENDVVFDVGANMGLFTSYALWKKASVYAFEPNSLLCKELSRYEKWYRNKLKVVTAALADSNGYANFSDGGMECAGAHIDNTDDKGIKVEIKTIDEYVKCNKIDKIDFIKADIEGAERHMLLGATETMKNHAPKLAICTYHLKDDKEILEAIIKQANPQYKVIHKWKKLFAYVE